MTVRGDIVQRDRKPLPADAEVRVWLDHADNPTPLAEQVFRTEGRQWPIPFALSIDPARVEAGRSYRLRVIVKSDGRIQYVTGGRVNVAPDKVPDGLAILVVPGETERLFQETEAPFRLGPGSRSPSRGEGRPREGR